MDEFPGPPSRLPRGRHPLPEEMVAAMQRERIMGATAEVVAREGFRAATLEQVVKEAKVAWTTFYDVFPGKEEAFLATLEDTIESVRVQLAEAVDAEAAWEEQVIAGVTKLLELAAKYPARSKLVFVEAQAVSDVSEERRKRAIGELAAKLREGRALPGFTEVSVDFEEPLVGGMFFTVSNRIVDGGGKKVEALIPDLVERALAPYIGQAEARKRAAALAKRRGK